MNKLVQAMADVIEGYAIDETGGNIAVNEEEALGMAMLLAEAGFIHVEDERAVIVSMLRHIAHELHDTGLPFITSDGLLKMAEIFENASKTD